MLEVRLLDQALGERSVGVSDPACVLTVDGGVDPECMLNRLSRRADSVDDPEERRRWVGGGMRKEEGCRGTETRARNKR